MNSEKTTSPASSRDEILTAAANGNGSALEFLRVFTRRAQWVDDLRDRDKLDAGGWYEASAFASREAEWLLCLASNPFFAQYRAQLVPVMVLGLNAWVDSEDPKWKARSRNEVLAGLANEVFWLVAWLTGGWQKMRDVSAKYRDYDVEDSGPEMPCEDAERCGYCNSKLHPLWIFGTTNDPDKHYCSPACSEYARLKHNAEQAGKTATEAVCLHCLKPIPHSSQLGGLQPTTTQFCDLVCASAFKPHAPNGKETYGLGRR